MTRRSRRLAAATVGAVVLGLLVGSPAEAATSITINGTGAGKTFDGVGAVSGGGGTSRLLPDYPTQQRDEILDYLFKPNFGASLQMLKVEIGGDTNSTNGAEPSHMRSRTDLNCDRGYEWWLMQQAHARNPAINLGGLAWGAPGWLGNGQFDSQDTIDYLIKWINCASAKGLTIDHVGGQNEAGYSKSWLQSLKAALRARTLNTRVVAGDALGGDWGVVDDMTNDAAFRNAVDIAGVHYPCGHMQPATSCTPPNSNSANLAKPVWASEQGSQHYDDGAAALARALNRQYIDGRMTASLNWSAISSWYKTLPYAGSGLMRADQPWSGNYQVGKSIWVTAHTTQFAQPGWRYLNGASGYLGGSRSNGSYVSLRSPNGRDYSSIIETMDATAAQTATFTITGGLSTSTVHVWASNIRSANTADHFVRQADVAPANGTFTVTLKPGYVYSLTTTTGQAKGASNPPAARALALPYTENFDSYPAGSLVKYFSDVAGGFDTHPCGGGRTGICLRQQISTAPIAWPIGSSSPPVTVTGDPDWRNYQVGADVLLEHAGYVDLIGRSAGVSQFGGGSKGYHLRVTDTGQWSLFGEDDDGHDTTLASGTTSIGLNRWHRLTLNLNGSTLRASIDATVVATVTNSSYSVGQIGLLVSKWRNAQFDNVSVTTATGNPGPVEPTGPITGLGGKCVDVAAGGTANGTAVLLWDCHGESNQQWTVAADGTLRSLGKCLSVEGNSTADGAKTVLSDCAAGDSQVWRLQANGNLRNASSGKCLDVPAGDSTNGTQLIIWSCQTASNQTWTLPA
jgi:hypothetical protein